MKRSVNIGILSSGNILLSFITQWYVIINLGLGRETDAFFAGMTIPQLVVAVMSGPIVHVLVPWLSGQNEDDFKHDTWLFFIILVCFFSALTIILYISSSTWVPLIFPGFDIDTQKLTIDVTRIQIIGMFFSSLNGFHLAVCHAKQRFVLVESLQLISALIGFALLIWILPKYGIKSAAWVASLRYCLQFVFLSPNLGLPCFPHINKDIILDVGRRLKPLIFGAIYFKSDKIVTRFLLSSASNGSLSSYYLATQLYEAAGYVIDKAITSPAIPIMSSAFKNRDVKFFKAIYNRKIIFLALIGVFVLLCAVLLGHEVLSFILIFKSVNSYDVTGLWYIVIGLSGLLLGGAGASFVSRSFYAINNTITPTRITSFLYTINIPFNIIAFEIFGVVGLAISVSTYQVLNFIILMRSFKKELLLANIT